MLLGFRSLLTLQRLLTTINHPNSARRIKGVLRAQKLDAVSPL